MVPRFAATLLALLSLAIAGPVLVAATVEVASATGSSGGWSGLWRRAGISAGCALAIATLATPAGAALALATRRWPARLLVLALLPLLLPQYLAFAGWGVLLDPSTPVGDWLARRSAESEAPLGLRVRRALAVATLALWAAPLAWLTTTIALRRVPGEAIDALRLEPLSRTRCALATLAMVRPGVLLGFAIVFVVMLGSAVPLDLAQIDTLGNDIRLRLSLGDRAGAWARAGVLLAPAVLLAAGLGAALGRRGFGAGGGGGAGGAREPLRPGAVLAAGVLLVAAAGAPLALSLATLREPAAIWRFLDRQWAPLADSLATAGLVGLVGLALAWAGATCRLWGRRVAIRLAVVLLLVTALAPGVLVGAAWSSALSQPFLPAWLLDSRFGVVAGHAARFGVVAVLAGVWIGSLDPPQRREAARLDRADRPLGHLLADLARLWPPLLGSALLVSALSLHEIEATVLLAPPGTDSLARRLLEMLHYQRRDDLAAGVAVLSGAALALALAAMALARRPDPRRRRNRRAGQSL